MLQNKLDSLFLISNEKGKEKKSDLFPQPLGTELKCRLFCSSNSDCSKVLFCFFFKSSIPLLTYGVFLNFKTP